MIFRKCQNEQEIPILPRLTLVIWEWNVNFSSNKKLDKGNASTKNLLYTIALDETFHCMCN